jgi:hypothetical protein
MALNPQQKVYDLLDRLILVKKKELARNEKACLKSLKREDIEQRYKFQSDYYKRDVFDVTQDEADSEIPLFLDRKPFFHEVIDKLQKCLTSQEEIETVRSTIRDYRGDPTQYSDEDDKNRTRIKVHILPLLYRKDKVGQTLMQQIRSQCIPDGYLHDGTFMSKYLRMPCFEGSYPSKNAMDALEQDQEFREMPPFDSSDAAAAPYFDAPDVTAHDAWSMGEGGKKSRSSKKSMSSKRSKRKSRSRSRKSRSKSNKRKKQRI